MYDNDYFDISLSGVATWLAVPVVISVGIGLDREPALQKRLSTIWTLFPAIGIAAFCTVAYAVVPDDRYMSPPGWHWLIMLAVAGVVSIILTPPWAFVVWLTLRMMRGYRSFAQRRTNNR